MHNFIFKERPKSYNSLKKTKKLNYKIALENAFKSFNPSYKLLEGNLYATIYYFFNKNFRLDVDNLSKPVWNCLGGFLYEDDNQIRIRTAGSLNLELEDYNIIDMTGLKGSFVLDLLDAFENEEHIVYIECGKFEPSMFKFNIE
ncbi:MAG: RusA family crossover junction endodeoxyribonuclease [Flavobacteriales bacterium]